MAVPIGVESWLWYSVAMLVVTIRFISRYVQLESLKRLQPEDYLMMLAMVFYTILIVLLNTVSDVQTNLIAPEDLPSLTPENIVERVRGSKMVLVLQTCMCCVIWLCKTCILLLYYRLTFGLTQHIVVKATGVYVIGSFILMMTLYFAVWCRPFSGYWETPSQNVQCTTATHHLITNFTFNLSSDLIILFIPLPLLLRSSSLPLSKKIALTALFSLGIFIMICTILSKYYSFRQPFSPIWIFWYTREASTAMVVTNMTHVWTLVRRVFHLKSFTGSEERRDANASASRISFRRRSRASQAGANWSSEDAPTVVQTNTGGRDSVPFADIGGLLVSSTRSSMAKSQIPDLDCNDDTKAKQKPSSQNSATSTSMSTSATIGPANQ